jgi:hypothetical protein
MPPALTQFDSGLACASRRAMKERLALHPKFMRLLACFVAVLTLTACPLPTFADEKPQEDAYASVWESLSDLLRRREYGTATALLDSLADDPKLRGHAAQIEADKAVVAGLQTLQRIVREQAAKLSVQADVEISGIEYRLENYDRDIKGDALVLKAKSSGRETRQPVASLPSVNWLRLAEPKLDSLPNAQLVLGVFAGFDQSSDPKAARKFLNDAANDGADVTRWLARLEDAANRKPAPVAAKAKANSDPIAGHWRIVLGKDKWVFNLELRADGTSVATLPVETLIEMRKRRLPLPRSSQIKGKWLRNEDGTYEVTMLDGATAQFAMVSDRLLGKNARGDSIVAMREVKK